MNSPYWKKENKILEMTAWKREFEARHLKSSTIRIKKRIKKGK